MRLRRKCCGPVASGVRLHRVTLCFLSLMELFFRVLGSYGFVVSLLVMGMLGPVVGKPALPTAAATTIKVVTAYAVPALVSWLVLKLLRAKARLPVPLPGRHWLVAGLLGSVAGHVVRFGASAFQSVPWLFTALYWLSLASIGLLVVGLVLAFRSLRKPPPSAGAQGNNAT
jgi:hypothetical protein